MKVIQRGHVYELDHRDGDGSTIVSYFNAEPGHEAAGVLQQEVVRMMLDRNRYCNNCLPHPDNAAIQYHLRMVLAIHEGRALQRKAAKGEPLEEWQIASDGHFDVPATMSAGPLATEYLDPAPPVEGVCKYSSGER